MKKKKQLLGILLTLMLMLGLMVGMSVTAYADDDPPYAQYKNTTNVITFDSKSWYLIDYDASTVTLLAKDCVGASKYNKNGNFVEYSSNPTVKTAVDDYYTDNISEDAQKAVSGNAMFLLTTEQANAITNAEVRKDGTAADGWWLCSQGNYDHCAAFVDGGSGDVKVYGRLVDEEIGVRPALTLNLSSVIFSSESKTFSTIGVTGVSLSPSTKQTIAVGSSVAFTATVTPDNATDKKVTWSVGGENSGAVKLYSNEACTTEVGTDATSTLTVYAKGITEGSATVTATSNSDNTKSASCAVTVLLPHTHAAGTPGEDITFKPWTSSDGLPDTKGNYYLTEDVTLSSAWEVPAGVTSLCLNGHGIKFNGTNIWINRTLNLYDCDTSTKHSFTVSGGLATIDDTFNENHQTFTGGYITRGNNSSNGGGVRAYGTFNMYGGTIIGNNNGNNGGGVNVVSGATFNMTGGSIMYNTASGSGGGVNTVETFNMDEGSIENNTAGDDGGGVNIGMNGKLNMTGGSITDNIANADDNKDGGGVWVSSEGQFKVSGAPKITRNTTKNATKNVFLTSTSEITVNGPLKGEGDSKVGVTMKTPGVFTNEWNAIMGSTANPADYFFSDNSDYGVTLTTGDNPEAQLLRCYPLKYDSNGGSGSMTSQSVYDGGTFTFPKCTFTPPRNKTLDHWKMSGVDGIFQPGQQVTITSNCVLNGVITVTAYWKDASGPTPPTPTKISGIPLAKMTAKDKDKLVLEWLKTEGADGYDIFFARCNHNDKKIKTKKSATIKGNKTFTWTKSGLEKGKAYKACVKAYVMKGGKKQYVKASPLMHAFTAGGNWRFTNAKKVTVKKASLSINVGKKAKIKAKVKKLKPSKKLVSKRHAPKLRYLSTDTKIATVSKKGKVTGVSKGTCYVYAYAHNGVFKKIKITVR